MLMGTEGPVGKSWSPSPWRADQTPVYVDLSDKWALDRARAREYPSAVLLARRAISPRPLAPGAGGSSLARVPVVVEARRAFEDVGRAWRAVPVAHGNGDGGLLPLWRVLWRLPRPPPRGRYPIGTSGTPGRKRCPTPPGGMWLRGCSASAHARGTSESEQGPAHTPV